MSCGYYSPGPAFTGPDAGEVGDNRAAKVEAAHKTAVGVTEYGHTVYQLDEDVQYWAVEPVEDQYGWSIGTTLNHYVIPAGTLVVSNNKWAMLRWPTIWTDFATSTEWRAGERSGPLAAHQKTRMFPTQAWVDDKTDVKKRRFEACLAARWVVENVDLPDYHRSVGYMTGRKQAEFWYGRICEAQYEALRGYGIEWAGEFVVDALRQYARGESDKARKAREDARRAKEEEEWMKKHHPFAKLAVLLNK